MPGDRPTFEQFVLPHLGAAYNLARHLVRAEVDAADIVQESLRAWRYLDSFRGRQPADGLPWFLQIVRRTAWTHLERRQTQPLPEDIALIDDHASDPPAEAIQRVDLAFLQEAVAALPPVYREAIVLRELQGLSYREICTVTGASMGTVMSRLSRARQQLLAAASLHLEKEARHDV